MKILGDEDFCANPYYFIHIPKCGGHSVCRAISYSIYRDRHIPLSSILDIVGHSVLKDKYIFAVVRNPWDRLVSWFYYFYRDEINVYGSNFKYWISNGCKVHWDGFDPLNMQNYITCSQGIPVDTFKIEEWSHCQNVLINRGIQAKNLKRLNINKHRKNYVYRDFYDAETKKIVYERYHEDIDNFKYVF